MLGIDSLGCGKLPLVPASVWVILYNCLIVIKNVDITWDMDDPKGEVTVVII